MPVTFNPETKIREFDLNDDSADDFVERLNVTPEIEMNLDEDDFLSERLRVNKPVEKSMLKKSDPLEFLEESKKKLPAFTLKAPIEKPGDIERVVERMLQAEITMPNRFIFSTAKGVREELVRQLTRKRIPVNSDDEDEEDIHINSQSVNIDDYTLVDVLSVVNGEQTKIMAKDLGTGHYKLMSEPRENPDGLFRSYYASSAIYVNDVVLGNKNYRTYRAMIDPGCETVMISKKIADDIGCFVDTNHRWYMVPATNQKIKYYGVIHDCKVTVGGISRLCQVWVQDLDKEQILLGRVWQKAVLYEQSDHPNGDTIIKMSEFPDGSGRRLSMTALTKDTSNDRIDIGYQEPFESEVVEENAVNVSTRSVYVLPDLSFGAEFGGSVMKEIKKVSKNGDIVAKSGSNREISSDLRLENDPRTVIDVDKKIKGHFTKEERFLKKNFREFIATEADIWSEVGNVSYQKDSDEILQDIIEDEPNEDDIRFARQKEKFDAKGPGIEVRSDHVSKVSREDIGADDFDEEL
ncbi:hypothetical protein HK096_010382, partial [Nowakowskiella sp. JEL0078]